MFKLWLIIIGVGLYIKYNNLTSLLCDQPLCSIDEHWFMRDLIWYYHLLSKDETRRDTSCHNIFYLFHNISLLYFIIISSTCSHSTKELQQHHIMTSSTPICAGYLCGNSVTTLNFNSVDKYVEWHHDAMAIKDKIAWINTTWYPAPRI